MPARDTYHNAARKALEKDGWAITHDPLVLKWGNKDLYVDLGAEQVLAAEKGNEKIAVEVKSFISQSEVQDLKNAVGSHIVYNDIMAQIEPSRTLYLAVRTPVFESLFTEQFGRLFLTNGRIRLIVFDAETEEIVQWIS